jgi:DNA end-binding protein Ku
MAMRSSWEGFLRLSLISVPVRAYNAAIPGRGEIHFHMIHKGCGKRIRYQKICPEHGEVSKEEIVSGYEYEKGQYLEVDPAEISKLRAESDEAINIDVFFDPDKLDPIYLSGRMFFLVPDGPAGQKPYVLLHQVMKEKNRHAVARLVLAGHEETVLIRPLEKLLTMTVLLYADQVKKPSAFEDEISDEKISAQELKLASTLVDASTTDQLDYSHYKDLYTERVSNLIEAKLAGRKLEAPHHERAPAVINLLEALRKSLDRTGRTSSRAQHGRRHRAASPRKKTG